MKNSKAIPPVLAALLCVSLSCTFLKEKFVNAGKPADEFRRIAKLSPIDPNAPLVSPGAVAVRKLAEIDPAVAVFAANIEATERGAMKKVITANVVESDANKKEKVSIVPSNRKRTATMAFARPAPIPALLMLQAGGEPLPGTYAGVFVGMFVGGLKSMISQGPTGDFHGKLPPKTETIDGDTATMEVEVGGSKDGSTVTEMVLKSESTKNGVKVNTEMLGKIEGNDCPNAEGQVQITMKIRLSARSGGAGYTQDVTAFIRILVDDNANNVASTIDMTQKTSRSKAGQEVFVETGDTIKYTGGNFDSGLQSNGQVIQKTDSANEEDVNEAWKSGQAVAHGAAIAAIRGAQDTWKGGKCIMIEARSPGSVEPSSGIEIPVKVRHKRDGSEVAAKLDVNLVGEASIDPTLVPKTPGTLTYIAPNDTGRTATIKLKATSRRGVATLDLTASTGTNAYQIEGGLDDWYTNTIVCDITKPFTLTGGGFTIKFSGGLEGTYEYSGPFNAKGTGTYDMSFSNGRDKWGHMVGRGDGTIEGGGKIYKGSGTEEYSLKPVDGPCVDGPVQE